MEYCRILKQSKTKKLWQHFLGIMLHSVLEHRDFIISVLGRHKLFYTQFIVCSSTPESRKLVLTWCSTHQHISSSLTVVANSLQIGTLFLWTTCLQKKTFLYRIRKIIEGGKKPKLQCLKVKNSKFICYSAYLQEANCFCASFPHLMNHCCLSPHRYPRKKG